MRVVAFPHSGIAYNDAFYDALEKQGVDVLAGYFAGRWLLKHLRKDDIVHVHWPSFFYESSGTYLQIFASLLRFCLLMSIIRLKGVSIFWTAHNLMPHVRCRLAWVDVICRKIIIRLSKKVFVHGKEAEKVLIDRFPECRHKCVVIPHGNWIGFYPQEYNRQQARNSLGIAQTAFVFLLFGQCKPYKNADGLITAFKKTARETDFLLIVGTISDKDYLKKLIDLSGGDSRIIIEDRFVPDNELSKYLEACDVMCIPYREILTSGSAILSMGFGVPVVSIDRGFLRDVITPETGLLIKDPSMESLVDALETVRKIDWSKNRIIAQAGNYTFEDAARIFKAQIMEGQA